MSGMSRIVKTMSNIIFPFVMIFGLYVIAHGHLTPGGGFQGGAVVASACAMILVAYGSVWTMKKIKEKQLSILESLGAIGFIGLAFLGLVFADKIFFDNFIMGPNGIGIIFNKSAEGLSNINTAGVLPLMNFAVGLKVIAGLFAIVLVMAYATVKVKEVE
ncbi:sodium:proton antiporter [Thermococci archaeon]|nr:MAG: sodium:proton antiporter [Thermococci archaeon]